MSTKKYSLLTIFLVYLFLVIPVALAQSGETNTPTEATRPSPTVSTARDPEENLPKKTPRQKPSLNTNTTTDPELNRQNRTILLKEPKIDSQNTRKEFKEEVQAARQRAEEKRQEAQLAFHKKLQAIKDERKKIIVESINTKIATFNQNKTSSMSEALQKLTNLLERLTQKVTTLKSQGQDTTTMTTAITTAQSAINTAQTAITTQAGKVYTVQITTEGALKTTVGQTISQFEKDIKATHAALVQARQAVEDAAKIINTTQITGE